jgi:acyl-CoA synthetase (AMP-forming)/AMP-acid ligase II
VVDPRFPSIRATSGELVREASRRFGDKPFVVTEDQRTTFREAEEQSARLARALLASGVGKGTRVGLLAPNGPAFVIAWLAASRIGALVVLLNTYHRERELGRTLRHGDVQVLLSVDQFLGHDYLARLEAAAPAVAGQQHERLRVPSHPYLRSVWVWSRSGSALPSWAAPIEALLERAGDMPAAMLDEVEADVSPADPMIVVYSSGSTAEPKGVVHSQGAVVRHAHNLEPFRCLAADDVLFNSMPLFWVGGLSYTLIAALHCGATLVFADSFDPAHILDLIERERVTQVLGWPHVLNALAEHPSLPDRDLSFMRRGTAFSLIAEERERLANEPRANSLGMTETLGPHTIEDYRVILPASKAGSFGRPVPGVEHRIVDPLTGEPAPTGTIGELWVRGYSVMLGMLKRERDEVFTPDGWYRTGDSGYFDSDGHFFFTGRLGDTIKASGMNVTPREVEMALEALPEVALAFVTGAPHGDRGEEVIAAVLLVPGCDVSGDELVDRLRAELASYKVPRHIEVLRDRSELPWLDSGKVDLRTLTQRLRDARTSLRQP